MQCITKLAMPPN